MLYARFFPWKNSQYKVHGSCHRNRCTFVLIFISSAHLPGGRLKTISVIRPTYTHAYLTKWVAHATSFASAAKVKKPRDLTTVFRKRKRKSGRTNTHDVLGPWESRVTDSGTAYAILLSLGINIVTGFTAFHFLRFP